MNHYSQYTWLWLPHFSRGSHAVFQFDAVAQMPQRAIRNSIGSTLNLGYVFLLNTVTRVGQELSQLSIVRKN
jgi:hypothetical protein